jgi:hypothetical protein
MQVTAVSPTAKPYAQMTITPGLPGSQPPSTDVCGTPAGVGSNEYNSFWEDTSQGAFIMPVRGVSFRINWASGGPVLERQERTSDMKTEPPWVSLSRDVELIRVRLGVTSSFTQANPPVVWFPNPAATPTPVPPLDSCFPGTACDTLVPKDKPADPPWTSSVAEPNARDALMRRLRMVEFTVVTRTARADPAMVRKVGNEFELDAEGNPQDGFKRRISTVEVMPRNFAYAGVVP